jgi:ribosome biogenesis GTPase
MSSTLHGRVTRQDKTRYHVHTEQGELVARASATATPRPAVGDQVVVTPVPPTIVAVEPRRSALTRVAPDGREQVLAANVDVVLALQPLDRGVNERAVERYLAAVAGSGARGVVVLTKADVAPAGWVRAVPPPGPEGRL